MSLNYVVRATRNIHSSYGEESRIKEFAEDGLENSEGEISSLKMKIEQEVQSSSMMHVWHPLKSCIIS